MVDEDLAVAEECSAATARVQTHVTFGRHDPTLVLYRARLGDISGLQFAEDTAVRRELVL